MYILASLVIYPKHGYFIFVSNLPKQGRHFRFFSNLPKKVDILFSLVNGYMHRTLNGSMESQGYVWSCHCIHGTTWMDPWIHDLLSRFQMFFLQKFIQDWQCIIGTALWIHGYIYHHDDVYT